MAVTMFLGWWSWHPNTGEEIWPKRSSVWRYTKERHEQNVAENLLWWGRDGKASTPAFKRYRHKLKGGGGVVPGTWWDWEFAGHTDAAKRELNDILPDLPPEYSTITPKPVSLIERVIQIATDENALILDSFAGSGTTAHAVLEANKRDGGNRKFILVEMEEYADRLTAERVRRVINGYDYQGVQKTELLRKRLNWRNIENSTGLVHSVEGVENLEKHKFDRIKKDVKDGELLVTGEKIVTERTEGLGGAFTYCTLGPAIELDRILTGDDLPAYAALGAALFHMATNRACDSAAIDEADFFLGEIEGQKLWLIYKPDLEWLKSPDAALTLSRAKAFADSDKTKKHLVFAPARYVSQKVLADHHLAVEFVPLPFALYRIERV